MNEFERYENKEIQPWWNDKDKVSGGIATALLLTALTVIIILTIGGALAWVSTWFK